MNKKFMGAKIEVGVKILLDMDKVLSEQKLSILEKAAWSHVINPNVA